MHRDSTTTFLLLLAGAVQLGCGQGGPGAGSSGSTVTGDERRNVGGARGDHRGGEHDPCRRGDDEEDDLRAEGLHDGGPHHRRRHHPRPRPCEPEVATFALGGSVAGLTGTLGLHEASAGDLTVVADGPFRFGVALPDGTAYDVVIAAQPAGQTCTVAQGSGAIAGADVSNVAVTCVQVPPPPVAGGTPDATFGVGGKVTTDFSGRAQP